MEPVASNTESAANVRHGWIASLLFWLSLIVAVGLFAIATLSPRLHDWIRLRNRYHANQVRLVGLEKQIDFLSTVSSELRDNPDFAAELARVDLGLTRFGDERIPVSDELTLRTARQVSLQNTPEIPLPAWSPFVDQFALSRRLRLAIVVAAGVLIVLAFTCMNESSELRLRAAGAGSLDLLKRGVARYIVPDASDESADRTEMSREIDPDRPHSVDW